MQSTYETIIKLKKPIQKLEQTVLIFICSLDYI